MKNKERKAELIKDETFRNYLIRRNEIYKKNPLDILGKDSKELAYVFDIPYNDIECLEQMRMAKSKQTKEIRRHIRFMLNMDYDLIFSTYTLTNDALNENNLDCDRIRDKLTAELRKSGAKDWIGNIDYGNKTDRLHYHVIEAYEHGMLKKEINWRRNRSIFKTPVDEFWNENMGYTYNEELGKGKSNEDRTSLYLAKLTAHTLKIKAKRIFTNKKSSYQRYKKEVDLMFWDDEEMMKVYCSNLRKREEEKKERRYKKVDEIIEQLQIYGWRKKEV